MKSHILSTEEAVTVHLHKALCKFKIIHLDHSVLPGQIIVSTVCRTKVDLRQSHWIKRSTDEFQKKSLELEINIMSEI